MKTTTVRRLLSSVLSILFPSPTTGRHGSPVWPGHQTDGTHKPHSHISRGRRDRVNNRFTCLSENRVPFAVDSVPDVRGHRSWCTKRWYREHRNRSSDETGIRGESWRRQGRGEIVVGPRDATALGNERERDLHEVWVQGRRRQGRRGVRVSGYLLPTDYTTETRRTESDDEKGRKKKKVEVGKKKGEDVEKQKRKETSNSLQWLSGCSI